MKNIFQKCWVKDKEKNGFYVIMSFYKSKKINYREIIDFVRDYIKSLLLVAWRYKTKKYFISKSKKIEADWFWFSIYSDTTSTSHLSTFPFIPSENNFLTNQNVISSFKKIDIISLNIMKLNQMTRLKKFVWIR